MPYCAGNKVRWIPDLSRGVFQIEKIVKFGSTELYVLANVCGGFTENELVLDSDVNIVQKAVEINVKSEECKVENKKLEPTIDIANKLANDIFNEVEKGVDNG